MIRAAKLSDAAGIAWVQINSYRTAYAPLMPAEYLAAFSYEEQEQDWKKLIGEGSDLLLIAEDEAGQIVGYALSRLIPSGQANYDCELAALHINRSCHRQGIGRALVAETAWRMHRQGCRSLGLWILDGNPACGFYEHLGGKTNGEQFFEIEELKLRRREVGYLWERIEDLFQDH